jgi:hypothetical protein
MTQRERLKEIFAAHDKAVGDMALARQEMRASHRHIVTAMHAFDAWASAHDAAAEAQDLAVAAMMEANRAAIALLNEGDEA